MMARSMRSPKNIHPIPGCQFGLVGLNHKETIGRGNADQVARTLPANEIHHGLAGLSLNAGGHKSRQAQFLPVGLSQARSQKTETFKFSAAEQSNGGTDEKLEGHKSRHRIAR